MHHEAVTQNFRIGGLIVAAFFCLPGFGAEVPTPVTYTTFEGATLSLYAWQGQKVALLSESPSLNSTTMQSILSALDAAWGVYEQITGANPIPLAATALNGKDIVAEVPDGSTCGAACSYLGTTGTQITARYFDVLYNGVLSSNQYDQVLFYEFGRNFWFYSSQLGTIDPFVTGFAIANRFISMDRIGVNGGPFNGTLPYTQFESSILTDLLQTYLNNPSYDWRNTLGVNQAPPTLNNWSAADLAGAMFYRIYSDFGITGYTAFWSALRRRPAAATPDDAVSNFIAAAQTATGRDYTYLFKTPPPTGAFNYYFPHLAFGGGWQTTFTYVNYSRSNVSCQTTFFSDSGTSLLVPFAGGAVSSRTDNLSAGASVHTQTQSGATTTLLTGWAQAECTGPVKASLLYRLYNGTVAQGEAGVNAATTPANEFVSFAETQTGIAFANPSPLPATITITALDTSGLTLGSTTITIQQHGHSFGNVGPLLGVGSFTGSVQVTSSIPVLVLLVNAEAYPVFSSMPPADLPAGTPLSAH